ncbi:hypothetical protein HanRHA438_Chr11g0517571 [Helianthus annuus]|uniref:Uncharacterized protein n=1 Tax=Helianthus annuus TaxID=4232 RepID=A0A251VBC6_HELAN|nr:hypothetical protein HanXRQr2_Chr11g0505001 [Helianthus annuus]KAJ0871886.1 hypothetical protein HanRHA438_Chr11g0517571 [Helianthus annuus]
MVSLFPYTARRCTTVVAPPYEAVGFSGLSRSSGSMGGGCKQVVSFFATNGVFFKTSWFFVSR